MEKFNFGEIPVNTGDNEIPEIKNYEKSSSQKTTENLINCLSSFYEKKNNLASPENKKELKKLLIALTITFFSSSLASHFVNKKSESDFDELVPNVNHSLKAKITEEKPAPEIKLLPNLTEENPVDEMPREISMEKTKTIVEEIHSLSKTLTKDEKLFPSKLFSKTFLTAIKITESGLNPDTESDKGAVGTMQIMPTTIREVLRYLNKLQEAKIINSKLPQEDELTKEDIREISALIKSDASYGDAFGEIYLMDLFNHFGIGQEIYALGGVTKARKKILVAYNWSPDNFKRNETKEENWPAESRQYYKKIFRHMEMIKKIQVEMSEMKMLTDIYDLSPILTLEIRKYEKELSEENPRFDETIKKVMRGYLDVIFEMEKIKEKPLTPEEVKRLINKFNNRIYRDYQNHITKGTDFESSAFEL